MLVGLIPFSHLDNDLKNPSGFHNLLLAPKFTILQKSIEECILMGCDIIYLFCGPYLQKYVKAKFSTYVIDIYDFKNTFSKYNKFLKSLSKNESVISHIQKNKIKPKVVPIIFHKQSLPVLLYNPIKSQTVTAMFGAFEIHGALSTISDTYDDIRFYVAFPQTSCLLSKKIQTEDGMAELYSLASQVREQNCIFVHNEQSIITGTPASFSFDIGALTEFRRAFVRCANEDKFYKNIHNKSLKEFGVFENNTQINIDTMFVVNKWINYIEYIRVGREAGFDVPLNLWIEPPKTGRMFVTSYFDNIFPRR